MARSKCLQLAQIATAGNPPILYGLDREGFVYEYVPACRRQDPQGSDQAYMSYWKPLDMERNTREPVQAPGWPRPHPDAWTWPR